MRVEQKVARMVAWMVAKKAELLAENWVVLKAVQRVA
jgi:hypothetical protein